MTTEELLLLNNLMYIQPEMQAGDGTIDGWLTRLEKEGRLQNFKDDFTSHEEWMSMIDTVRNSDLGQMEIKAADTESLNGGNEHSGAYNVILTNDKGEATVLFSGTRGEEWGDDFYGGGPTNGSDGVSTTQQEKALSWYQEKYKELGLEDYNITVTGHSKGGNKAKYITILDETIDNCVSFDGQGFSDDFLDEYSGKIAENQSKIQNHNCDNDYVNILLNDVGETTYYKGNSDNVGNFIENHCADAILHKDENGNFVMIKNPDGQAQELKTLDRFFNNCLRSLNGEERRQMMNTLGDLIQAAVSSEDKFSAVMRELASDPKNSASVAYLLAYMIKYQQENPEMMESLSRAFSNFGMGDVAKYVEVAKFLMENDTARHLLELLVAGAIGVADLLSKLGLDIPIDDLKMILGILGMTEVFKDVVQISPDDGEDRKIGSGEGGRPADFHVHTQAISDAAETILRIKGEIDRIQEDVGAVKDKLFLYNFFSFGRIRRLEERLQTNARECKKIGESLAGTARVYDRYETNVIDKAAAAIG